jgi:hypothetical protein
MDEKRIGNAVKAFQRILFVKDDGLFRSISTGGHDRNVKISHHEVMQRSVGQHGSQVGIVGCNLETQCQRICSSQQDDGGGRGRKEFSFLWPDQAMSCENF